MNSSDIYPKSKRDRRIIMNIGYIRVSSAGQNLARQDHIAQQCEKTFTEKASAKTRQRPQLEALQDFAREGDTVHVASIDRLARDVADLHNLIRDFHTKGVTVRFHKENLTFTPDETASPADKLMLSVMGAIGEFERALITERRLEGIAAAKAKGKITHRPRALSPEQVEDVKRQAAAGVPKALIAREAGVSRNVVYRALRGEYDAPEGT